MASVASSGTSPLSGYDYDLLPESLGDDGSWGFIDPSGSSNPGSIGFLPSPASGSLASYGVVGHHPDQVQPSPPAPSPLYLDMEQASTSFPMHFPDQTSALSVSSAPDGGFLSSAAGDPQSDISSQFMASQDFIFGDQPLQDLTPFLNNFSSGVPHSGLEAFDHTALPTAQLEIPPQLQTSAHVQPWNPAHLKQDAGMFIIEDINPSRRSPSSSFSASVSPPQSASPRSPDIKLESGGGGGGGGYRAPIPIRKVKNARVEKKKSSSASASSSLSSTDLSGGGGSKFVIVTPTSISAHAGKHNPFECFEAMRTSQKGRKGPLANDTKQNALQVRRLGACFCCHARKVKCDAERPCRNCKKLAVNVPQVVCWQFQDFLTVLFPEFIRGHFKKDEMARFVTDNIESFTIDGADKPCTVELSSGARFGATLTMRAKFFTAKTAEVLQHWHMKVEANELVMESKGAAPIGLELDTAAQRDELRKKTKEYIHLLTQEPSYADQLTDSLTHTELPRKVLAIVQRYAKQSESPIVKRALSIYAMHYVLTRHLCMTRQSIVSLQHTKLVPQQAAWVTPRVLNRQIKAVVDELLAREMQQLFEAFSKSLKPKLRREWAPCTAAFLVLCLFMEAVESAADLFVTSQNEIDLRSDRRAQFDRHFALNINKEVENLPFKQFAYQFHQIYQTHVRDATTRAFNPLVDDTVIEAAELDPAGLEMVIALRELLVGDSWHELDFLTVDPILGNIEAHPFPRDTTFNYTGRLTAKFLLSFQNEHYIFGPPGQ